jgi:hypothetical protein
MYPSGHTANILVVYGLCFHLIAHYGQISARTKRILLWAVCVLSVVMFTTSLTMRWHWFSDLVGGFLVGGAVLALTVGIDAALPFRSHRLVVLPAAVQAAEGQPEVPPEPVSVAPETPDPAEPESRAGDLIHAKAHGTAMNGETREEVSFRRTSSGSRGDVAGRRFRR